MSDDQTTTARWPSWPDEFIAGHLGLDAEDEVGYAYLTSLNPQVAMFRSEDLTDEEKRSALWQWEKEYHSWPDRPIDRITEHLRHPEARDVIDFTFVPDPVKNPPFITVIKR